MTILINNIRFEDLISIAKDDFNYYARKEYIYKQMQGIIILLI